MPADDTQRSVTIIGAGIIGLAAGLRLQRQGWSVTLVDRSGIGKETSSGNAGGLAHTDIAPLASGETVRNVVAWLFDPNGPLAIRPTALPGLVPWLWRFLKAGRPENFKRGVDAIAALNGRALEAWISLWRELDLPDQRRSLGCLDLFATEHGFRRALPGYRRQQDYGIELELLEEGHLIRQLEPFVGPRAIRAAFFPAWATIDDPAALCQRLGDIFLAGGGRFERKAVAAAGPLGDRGARLAFDDGSSSETAYLVVACGAWSAPLAEQLGDRVVLTSERGYTTTIPDPAVDIRRMLLLPEHGFVLSPLTPGLRVGGAVELGGLSLPPNYRRANALLKKAKRFVPSMRTDGGVQWMGHRPSLPDSLPVISYAAAGRRIVYAFGHAHHGLTQAAVTADLVADLLSGRTPPIDMAPYRASRF